MSVHVACPFYRRSGAQTITCEGFEPGQNITLGYRGKMRHGRQLREYCCKSYQCCEVYRMLMAALEE